MFKLDTPLARMKAVASGLLLLMAAALYVTALDLPMRNRYSPATSRRFRKQRWLTQLPTGRGHSPVPTSTRVAYPAHRNHSAQQGAHQSCQPGEFVCTHFLSLSRYSPKSANSTPPSVLPSGSRSSHAAAFSNLSLRLAGHSVGALRDEHVSQFVRSTALARLEQVDLACISGQLLKY